MIEILLWILAGVGAASLIWELITLVRISRRRLRGEGCWPANDLRRAFVEGAKWWEWIDKGATIWQSDQNKAEAEAEHRYPRGKRRAKP